MASPEGLPSGARVLIGIMLPGNGDVFGWRPPDKMLDNKSEPGGDMRSHAISVQI